MEKTLDSGAKLEVQLAPFEEAEALLEVVMEELGDIKIELGLKGKDLKEIFEMEITDDALNTIKNVVAKVISSKKIKAALWPCMGRALYNDIKIGKETFESETARGDYLVVVKEVLWLNLSPFCKNLGSLFKGILAKSTLNLKQ
jgi:hypothetical protein